MDIKIKYLSCVFLEFPKFIETKGYYFCNIENEHKKLSCTSLQK